MAKVPVAATNPIDFGHVTPTDPTDSSHVAPTNKGIEFCKNIICFSYILQQGLGVLWLLVHFEIRVGRLHFEAQWTLPSIQMKTLHDELKLQSS